MARHQDIASDGGGFAASLLEDRPGEPFRRPATKESFWVLLGRAFVMARIRQAELALAPYLERDEELLAAQRIFLGIQEPIGNSKPGSGIAPR
jgi:hypothetical protein